MAEDSRVGADSVSRATVRLFGSKWATSILTFAGLALFARRLGAAGLGTFFLFGPCSDWGRCRPTSVSKTPQRSASARGSRRARC